MSEILLVRHGETEWSKSGQHTSNTDLPLTEDGRERAAPLRDELAGGSSRWSSAARCGGPARPASSPGFGDRAEIDENLREWDYGEYEGLTTPQIREQNPDWDLWTDGCPGGEKPDEVGARADRVIARMRAADGDALAFAHGHILRVVDGAVAADAGGGRREVRAAPGAISTLGFERETRGAAGLERARRQ